MVHRISMLVIAAGFSTLMSACGGNGNSDATPFLSAAEGSWIQACLENAEDGDFEQDLLVIEGNSFTVTRNSFSDMVCSNKTQESTVSGTFTESGDVPVEGRGNATAIDLTVNSQALAFNTEDGATNAGNSSLCGITNWNTNVSVDVSNCADISGSTIPRQIFDIYLRENNSLYTGSEEGDTAETRPNTLDEIGVYTFVESSQPPPDGEDPGGAILPEDSLTLTAENGVAVAQFVMSQFDLIKGITNAANTGVISGAGNSEGRLTDLFISSSCEGGGAATISGVPAQLSSLTANYADCMIDGTVYNGAMSMTFSIANGPVGDPGSDWSFSTPVVLAGFSVNTGTRAISIDGDFILTTLHLAETELPARVSARFQGIQDEILMFNESNAVTRMIDFDFVFSYVTGNPVIYSDSFDEARLASSMIGGQITIDFSSGFTGTGFSVPNSAELEVFGANSSRLVIEADSEDAATISIDADGNNEFTDSGDSVITGTWAEFFGS